MTNIMTEAVFTAALDDAFIFLGPLLVEDPVGEKVIVRLEWPVERRVNWNIRWLLYSRRSVLS